MSTSVSSVVSHFPSAENGFTTTTSGSVSSGATTVGLNSVAGYSNGEIAVFIIDPDDTSKKQTFTGTIDTSGVQVTSVVWTAGTNQTHASGATVVDYASATHISMISKGLLVEHDQDGTHSAITGTSINLTGTATVDTIAEKTVANGVTIDGLNIKDGALTTASSVSFTNVVAGFVVQKVGTSSNAVSQVNTVIPGDDSIPQNTEGTEIFTLAITPKATSHILEIDVNLLVSPNVGNSVVAALFQDSTAGALAAAEVYQTTNVAVSMLTLKHRMTAGTTSATTLKVRFGPGATGDCNLNGVNSTRRFGDIPKSTMFITEYKA